ncbi:LOW QUALITY PROTEIN: basal cell adhesion molecule [Tupaia chinensis]|uniref:LOW QUALITY PROTEIN: basal cell adhesion molecule n=1 Tax=Tupaia chinensis TaxID=246437 RepID=UPI000704570D|nr:LOW QUALITY PROTEIN: basal cell adhesion molecule [Tupaia chinensis]
MSGAARGLGAEGAPRQAVHWEVHCGQWEVLAGRPDRGEPGGAGRRPPGPRAPRLLLLALLLAAHRGARAEVRVSATPLVEVMRGQSVTLDCTPVGVKGHYVLEWFLTDRSRARRRLASAELHGSELQGTVHDTQSRSPPYQLDSQGRLVLAEAQVGDERDYVCVVRAGTAGTAEATVRLRVFAKPETTEVIPNKGTLSVMEDSAQEIATCNSRNGNPVPQIMWYRSGQHLDVPMEMNPEGYMTSRTVREASGLLSLTSTLYLRLRKADRCDASFHCTARADLPAASHGLLDSPAFRLTLHYPTEHVQFWVGSPSTTEGWVREGDSVQLLCRGDGSPSLDYTFFRLQDQQEEVLNVNLEGNLTLVGVRRGQSGPYGCKVEDYDAAEGVQLSQTLELHVAYLDPLELSTQPELSVPLNGSTAVNCSAQGLPTPTVRWTKDSVPLGNGPTLLLKAITFDSAGTYTCEASMSTVPLLSQTQSFKLLVQGSPELRPEETQPKAEGSWREGDEVVLTCSARGYPEPKLTWNQLGGTPAAPAPGRPGWVSSSLTLRVTSALSRDGVSCEASNPHGNIQHVFHFGTVAPQTVQAGVAVMAVAVSVGLLLLVVAAFYCMRRKGRRGCCRRGEKAAPPPGEPELSPSGAEQPEQTGLLRAGASGRPRGGSGGFGEEC